MAQIAGGGGQQLGKPDRTAADDEDMLQRAYASRYHWARAARSGPANVARGAWLLSRVWAVLGDGNNALRYADECADVCADVCRANDLTDFDLAYAHEARARALACLGRLDEAGSAFDLALGVEIADEEDRTIVHSDLRTEPWFGLTHRFMPA
jgi:tetratricopeptide (TPR) repeat protein